MLFRGLPRSLFPRSYSPQAVSLRRWNEPSAAARLDYQSMRTVTPPVRWSL